jgi:glycosyltransferase involved in cell wall biosynthesis
VKIGRVGVISHRAGANIIGYFRGELGLGEAARLLIRALEAANIPHDVRTIALATNRQAHPFSASKRTRHYINIVCLNSASVPAFAALAGRHFFWFRHTIGFWFWELEVFPPSEWVGFAHVNEVWTASEFARAAIARVSPIPVTRVAIPLPQPEDFSAAEAPSFALPDSYNFLFMFDFLSDMERKNPLGVIKAYRRAFDSDDGTTLIIKTINGDHRPDRLQEVINAISGRPDVLVVDEYLTSAQRLGLISSADCYVSLHRSEGLGLTMAEAMAAGTPVIATRYSGNLSFMNDSNSYLVGYTMVEVPENCEPYPAGERWAEPDVAEAATAMKFVRENAPDVAARIEMARKDLRKYHSPDVVGADIARRLNSIPRATLLQVAGRVLLTVALGARDLWRRWF